MERLDNVIQPYAWGSRTAIAELQGRPSPSAGPEAELWLGAHPGAPSRVSSGSLLEHIRAAPERVLGAPVVQRFGEGLPFLLKVLAADTPLSLQAHPSLEQAREGHAREDALGVARTAAHRNYKDSNHKPELICALTPFDALCGFRRVEDTLALFAALGAQRLEPLLAPLRASPDARGLARTFEALMTLPAQARGEAVAAAVEGCARLAASGGRFGAEARWALRLAELYPGDPGVIGALLLNLLHLQPGEAIYLPAGNLHAYLQGVGVEIMANSDNVLRGGCTPKHVDVPELLRVLDFRAGPVAPLRATSDGVGEEVFETPAPEFRLSRLQLRPGARVSPARRGPEILLCTEGEVRVSLAGQQLALSRGESAFVAADEGAYSLEGQGVLFRSTVGEL
ncbi:mannose-6-phosphate isomerase, class I [Aggregicoccus sp. 17bor-14]|uniref:mannose-6-phosphate isomerase, class I n=1 Tax=Myxococcaceae TaxID=31 RepID=UPI00129C88B1|nr:MULTISPECIES: mannose-6-phosphate isomerase, class I [Myxococcaceae]MBF5042755.1 mannose-6-phosphate isomerase, class I [Simulacricoccus sp. 17bor-14]MRI88523.1 mannose-6-phosphate isomerase, class I [Aggregicoccus sp. 17bor-14]